MADEKFPKLRAMGSWGGHAATALTFLTTNWPLTLATIVAIGTGLNKWAWGIAVNPAVYASAGAFLFVLWTVIGLTYLVDRRKPREIKTHLDYRYGLTFEGFVPQYLSIDQGVPQAGSLGFGLQLRNFSPGPIHYRLESADIRLKNRAIPKYKANRVTGYMARGSGRTVSADPFDSNEIKDFYGAGNIEGTADLAVTYGPPDGAPIRRLTISMEIVLSLPKDGVHRPEPGHQIGWNINILSEEDAPF